MSRITSRSTPSPLDELIGACDLNDDNYVKRILRENPDLTLKDTPSKGRYQLEQAIRNKNVELVKLLYPICGDTNVFPIFFGRNDDGEEFERVCLEIQASNKLELLQFLIEKYPTRVLFSSFEACKNGNVDLVKFLYNRGLPTEDRIKYHFVRGVCSGNNVELAKYFIENKLVDEETIKRGFETACENKCMALVAFLVPFVDLKSYSSSSSSSF